jgi:hypothetical protein
VPRKTVDRPILHGECIDLFRAAIKYAEEHYSEIYAVEPKRNGLRNES